MLDAVDAMRVIQFERASSHFCNGNYSRRCRRSRCFYNFMSMEVVRWLRGPVLSHHLRLLDPANRGRDFAGTVLGGVWFIGELAGRVTWENVPCFKGLAEKSHADYFGVLGRYIAEKLAIYDLRKCGRLLEMKNKFCDDLGVIADWRIELCTSSIGPSGTSSTASWLTAAA